MDAVEGLTGTLQEAQNALGELPEGDGRDVEADARIDWFVRQLKGLESQLQAMLMDVEAGCTLSQMGFFGNEFDEMLDDIGAQIANLKGLMRTVKALGRE